MIPNPTMTLSGPAVDYGRAMCLPATTKAAPWTQLTPGQQACVTEVGGTYEHKVDAALGVPNTPARAAPTVHRETARIFGPTGQNLGTVEFDRGLVTVCWQQAPTAGTTPGCDFIGYGIDTWLGAQSLLESLGFRTEFA
jgi:hypothetical protein